MITTTSVQVFVQVEYGDQKVYIESDKIKVHTPTVEDEFTDKDGWPKNPFRHNNWDGL